MDISLVHDSSQADLTVEGLNPSTTLGDVLNAFGLQTPSQVTVDGRPVPLDEPATEALYEGAEVRIDEPAARAGEPVFELHAIQGPPAGRVWRLALGRYVIGDAPGAIYWSNGPVGRSELLVKETTVALDGRDVPTGRPVRIGNAWLRFSRPEPAGPAEHGAVTFNRPPRVLDPASPADLVAPSRSPQRGTARRLSLISLVLPAVFGLSMAVIFGRVMFLAFALMGPLMLIGNATDDRLRRKRNSRQREEQFADQLADFQTALQGLVARERLRRMLASPCPAELLSRVDRGSPRLWERRPEHPDFMCVPVGTGNVAWRAGFTDEHGLEPEVRDILDHCGVLAGVPVQLELREGTVIGLYGGERRETVSLVRAVVSSTAAHHGPADVRIAVLTDHPARWDWTKWLPHVRAGGGETRLLASDHEQAVSILRFLRRPEPEGASVPLTLLICDMHAEDPELRTLRREVLAGAGLPVAGLVIRSEQTELPGACTHLVEVEEEHIRLSDPSRRRRTTTVQPWTMTTETARHLARRLARLDDPEVVNATASLPDAATLLPMIGAGTPTPDDVLHRWSATERTGLTVPIGLGQGGPVRIDLVDDGPHGLIAGTTGSGKSELLRTIVAALAASHDTQHLNFVLVDYKGGAAFDACGRLPQVVGSVTDLDEHLGARALTCLEAELRYRERRLRAVGATDIREYAAMENTEPLPRMVLIVDEFAALAAELPEFMNALVDIAQRGRSLGVHMILATQRPSGVVKDSIRANTNLRISLRVQTPADSKDVIDDPAAARIPRARPGRGYLRLGPGELIPFQSAIATLTPGRAAGVRLRPFTFSMHDPAPVPHSGSGPSELDLLVEAIIAAHNQAGFPPPRRPWPEPLPTTLLPPDLETAGDDVPEGLVLGLMDEPELQRQRPFAWDPPADGNLLLMGSSGPRDAIRALAAGMARLHPDDAHIYAIDYGTKELAALADLPHTGAVIDGPDRERQQRLLRMLQSEISHRRSLRSARTQIFLMLNGLSGFRATFDEVTDIEYREGLHRIVAEGPAVGVFTVMAADQARSVPGALLGLFRSRLVFQLADRLDYAALGVRTRHLPDLCSNRAVDVASGRFVQVVVFGDAELRSYGTGSRESRSAPPVEVLPSTVKLTDLMHMGERSGTTWILPIGVNDLDLGPVGLRLEAGDHALITGTPRSGKSTALTALAAAARRLQPDCRIIGICPRPSPLREEPGLWHLLDGAGGLTELLEGESSADFLVLVDDADEVDDIDDVFHDILGSRQPGLHVVAAARSHSLRASVRHWTRALRSARRGLVLQPLEPADGEPLGVRLPRTLPPFGAVGRGYLCDGAQTVLIQTALP